VNRHWSSDLFEVLAVNDHSDDGGPEWLPDQKLFTGTFRLLNATGQGKKNALSEGILEAKGHLIVTVDADCIPHPSWLHTILEHFSRTDADMLIGPVKMRSSASYWSRFESVDFYALQMSGAASAMLGFPVFCSGANLAFKKSVWSKAVQNLAGTNLASGDDVFLLHAFKKLHKKILFINQASAMVETHTSGSVSAFFRQRMRWGGKTASYKDGAAIVLAIVVFLANLWMVLLWAVWIFTGTGGWFLAVAFLLKAGADYLFLQQGRQFFNLSYSSLSYLLYAVFYPFVIVVSAIGGLMLPEKWK
jgi:poly-beta-1,6-N-acetyl-D-glucosamine synthase